MPVIPFCSGAPSSAAPASGLLAVLRHDVAVAGGVARPLIMGAMSWGDTIIFVLARHLIGNTSGMPVTLPASHPGRGDARARRRPRLLGIHGQWPRLPHPGQGILSQVIVGRDGHGAPVQLPGRVGAIGGAGPSLAFLPPGPRSPWFGGATHPLPLGPFPVLAALARAMGAGPVASANAARGGVALLVAL